MGLQLPFLSSPVRKKRNQFISIDLGSRTTKAVLMERRGETLAMTKYVIMDAPLYEKKLSVEQLGDHLQTVVMELGNSTKYIYLALGQNDTAVRQVELPQIPVDEMRTVLRLNSKTYFQQEMPNSTFDCHITTNKATTEAAKQSALNAPKKLKVLAAAAKNQLVQEILQASRISGLVPDILAPAMVAPINAFESALPEVFTNESIAIVDIGFKSTSISIVDRGEFATNRTVNIGGDHFTTGLLESRGITYAEAEGIKIGMPSEVESELQMNVLPLGREIRALLDFFEHQQDRLINHVFFCGGSARSKVILDLLHTEVMADCKHWDPTSSLQLALPGNQAAEIEHVAPELTIAIGTAFVAN